MKFIVKVCKEVIKENFSFWCDKPINTKMNNSLMVTGINNYGMISAMYANSLITFNQFKLLERYNDRLNRVYKNMVNL